jgi:hypothetical protein
MGKVIPEQSVPPDSPVMSVIDSTNDDFPAPILPNRMTIGASPVFVLLDIIS